MNIDKLRKISDLKVVYSKVQERIQENNHQQIVEEREQTQPNSDTVVSATRHDYQISRRLFHMGNGFVVASAYLVMLTRQDIIYFLGTVACLLYVFDQIRIAYPEIAKKFEAGTKYIMRAEEQLKESAMIPYVMAILLCILSFPKVIAVASIFTLAFADPLSALIGIRFGKHHIVKGKSIEGSLAFLVATFLSITITFAISQVISWQMWLAAFAVSILATAFEMIPLRIDDNLTIPLFVAFTLTIACTVFGVPF